MNDKIVMRVSDDAAQYRTGLSGWVSRRGHFYGDGKTAEEMARYDGCTHVACGGCGNPVEKTWTKCQGCRDLADEARFDALPEAVWDGTSMLYSHRRDEYFATPDDAAETLEESETLADLQLVICRPNYVRPLEGDYCCEDLPEDGDVPAAVEEAMDAFNKAVHGIVLSWSPGKKRLAQKQEA